MDRFPDLDARKPVFGVCEQQRHRSQSLISAFFIRLLESIISKLAKSKFSFFNVVSAAEETGLSQALSETLKIGFFHIKAQIIMWI